MVFIVCTILFTYYTPATSTSRMRPILGVSVIRAIAKVHAMSVGSEILRFVLLFAVGLVASIQAQAPGDGDPLCISETIDGVPNPFFANHPMYSARERPLMDSRDYNRLLQGSGTYIPWQSVDRDNNNTGDFVTEVKIFPMTESGPYYNCMYTI